MSAVVIRGDARVVPLATASVDAIVCDPPYELGFMGRSWDSSGVAFQPETWAEALRVAKPGAYLLAFGGTRTYHRLTCAVEDVGWIVEDSIGVLGWVHAQGFPKGKNKLKPAWEPIVLARKRGPSALGVDACRVGTTRDVPASHSRSASTIGATGISGKRPPSELDPNVGRWPPNLVFVHHPDCQQVGERVVRNTAEYPAERGPGGLGTAGHAGLSLPERTGGGEQVVPVMACVPGCHVAELDAQSGIRTSGVLAPHHDAKPSANGSMSGGNYAGRVKGTFGGDTGGASRFYPVFRFNPKADTWERPTMTCHDGTVLAHPTVKPVDLMRWLIRLVCPPGGLVLDPFAGSGATLQAAKVEGFRSVGIELDPDSIRLISERLSWPVRIGRDDRFERIRPQQVPVGQLAFGDPA